MAFDLLSHTTTLKRRSTRVQAFCALALGLLLVGFGFWVMIEIGAMS
ncbi:hypothetical protein NO932_11720 [Pelagibacterium sp. 26DY04]|nr:hypothetical protein [Pelagibacterium sp. 26DY04]WMT85596.1 hypothetical protein NO932_11720 [Pelagibacterium sp. 26DY04]